MYCNYLYIFKERYNRLNENISCKLTHCSLNRIGLTIKYLHLGDIYKVLKKAINPPSTEAVKDAVVLLQGKIFITKYVDNLNSNSALKIISI